MNEILDATVSCVRQNGFALFSNLAYIQVFMGLCSKKSLAINMELNNFARHCIPSLQDSLIWQSSMMQGGESCSFVNLKSIPTNSKFFGMQLKLFVCGMGTLVVVTCGLTIGIIISPLVFAYWLLYKKGAGAFKNVKLKQKAIELLNKYASCVTQDVEENLSTRSRLGNLRTDDLD